MDDCSPDHTPGVAQSFGDPRIRYVRNGKNLGNIANYNEGIRLARGTYIWLISADDRLRCDEVLERYARVMDDHPEVGYVFCPAMAIEDGRETEMMATTAPFSEDTILKGRKFLLKLLMGNCISAPAALVRNECYEKVSLFPTDLPYAGDWYLWCVFAWDYDVAYLAEPMVCRRMHDRNLTKYFMAEGIRTYVGNVIEVPWQMKYRSEAAGDDAIARTYQQAIVAAYITLIVSCREQKASTAFTLEAFEHSLQEHAANSSEGDEIRALVYAGVADHQYWGANWSQASEFYQWALQWARWSPSLQAKYALARTGGTGAYVRAGLGAVCRSMQTFLRS